MTIAPELWTRAEALARALGSVRIAESRHERERIFSFRYAVYVDELRRGVGTVDPQRGWLYDPEDDEDGTVLLFSVAEDDTLTGTARIRCWPAGEASADARTRFSMSRFSGLGSLGTAEVGRVMMRPEQRRSLGLQALVGAACQQAAAERGVDVCFLTCLPGVVAAYRRLGFRIYDAPLVPTVDGLTIPMVLLFFDQAHPQHAGAALAPIMDAYYDPRSHRIPDVVAWKDLFDPKRLPLEFEPDAVLEKVRRASDRAGPGSAFLGRLDEGTLRKLIENGFLLSVRSGQVVTRQGLVQQELFVIIAGSFKVAANDRSWARGPGHVFGEIGFFGTNHQRTASVIAETDGQLLVIRRRWLETLKDSDPVASANILFELGRAMADRVPGPLGDS